MVCEATLLICIHAQSNGRSVVEITPIPFILNNNNNNNNNNSNNNNNNNNNNSIFLIRAFYIFSQCLHYQLSVTVMRKWSSPEALGLSVVTVGSPLQDHRLFLRLIREGRKRHT